MRVACFVFGPTSGVLAGLLALAPVIQLLYLASSAARLGNDSLLVFERTYYQWGAMVSGFATLGGLSFIASAIFRHAERPTWIDKREGERG